MSVRGWCKAESGMDGMLRYKPAVQANPDEPPPALGTPYKWERKHVSLLDNDAGGYTT